MARLLIPRDEVMSLGRAADHAGRSTDTIRRWCKEHGIARQAGSNAPLEISRVALEMVLHDDMEALALLKDDRRDHPLVLRYIALAGIHGAPARRASTTAP